MATPSQQRSRYPRPLKATHSFTASGETGAGGASAQLAAAGTTTSPNNANLGSSCHPSLPSTATSLSCGGVEAATNLVTAVGGSRMVCYVSPPPSPRSRTPLGSSTATATAGKNPLDVNADSATMEIDGENPRRSSSMNCLSDPDSYMNSTWPRLSPTNQGSDIDKTVATREGGFSHKRSNSCSGADRLPKTPPLKGSGVNAVHTRTSIEGLNQEVSSALEGKLLVPSQHPDGHRAPIRDLVGRPPAGTPTPPHTLGLANHAYPSSPSPSPYSPHPLSPSPSQTSHSSSSFTEILETPTGYSSIQSRESPGTPDNAHHHPSSPKPSFAHEPPIGAERCIIRQEVKFTSDYVPKGPDKSKASVVFRGSGNSAFAPLLSPHGLKPIGGVQC